MREAHPFIRPAHLHWRRREIRLEVAMSKWAEGAASAIVAVAMLAFPAAAADEPETPIPSGGEETVVVSSDVAKDRADAASFTDLDVDAIRDANVGQDLSTLLGDTMNAYSYSDAGNGYGYSYLRIRGFDQSRIAVNVNGVPLNTPESHQVYTIDLGDFAASLGLIQIQRGPGTALYGSPAVGGVVNLETAGLRTTPGGELEMAVGSFGTSRLSLRYGDAIGTTHWAWSVRAAHVQSDGYRDPSWSKQTFAEVAFALIPRRPERLPVVEHAQENELPAPGRDRQFLAAPAPGDERSSHRVGAHAQEHRVRHSGERILPPIRSSARLRPPGRAATDPRVSRGDGRRRVDEARSGQPAVRLDSAHRLEPSAWRADRRTRAAVPPWTPRRAGDERLGRDGAGR
jgi:outer membrane receptor protein involved in Fe transport